MSKLVDAALAWHDAGFCVLPAHDDGSKRPGVPWERYQRYRPDWTQVELWASTNDGIGIVCGAVSGNAEMLEIEGKAADLIKPFLVAVAEHSGELLAKVMTYVEVTPSGGYHFVYRVDGPVAGNTKLASRPADVGRDTLLETRGEGGWTVMAPSGGRTHPTGSSWRIEYGTPGVVATLTADERDTLHEIARTFDQMPVVVMEHREALPVSASGELTPGQDYEQRMTWADILAPEGWTLTGRQGDKELWTRPGKEAQHGPSATTNYDGNDNLYVFTSSTEFEPMHSYTKFAAYAVLSHHGDYSAAARELRKIGYGSAPKTSTAQAESKATLSLIHGGRSPITSGANALAPEEDSSPGSTLQQSEDGHAQLLIQAYGAVIRYAVEQGKWLWWDGARWHVQAKGGMVRELAKEVARQMPEDSPQALRHKTRALSANGTSGALTQACTDDRVVVNVTDLDARPRELNTTGGILDLERKTLVPADPSHLHTHMTACAPDWEADGQLWLDFLDQTFGDDAKLIAWVQRLVGYSAVGEVGPHVLPFCHGSGGNGKGVFLETIMAILGDYAAPAPNDFLMAGRDRHATEIADLAGKRLVVCSEVNEDDRFDEAKVKRLTGGDRLKGRFMARDYFSFEPTHTLWLVGNHDPEMKTGGRSMERRLAKIPFEHEVAEEDRIDGLRERLVAECGPAILAWIADGAAAYLAHGLGEPPEQVRRATEEYTHGSDTIAQFIEERCQIGGGQLVQVSMADVRHAYEGFCKELGVDPRTPKSLGQSLRRAGVEEGTNRGARGGKHYANLMLLAADDGLGSRDSDPIQGILIDP